MSDKRPWVQVREAVVGEAWRAALARHDGNIAHTAAEFAFTKQRAHALTKRLGLVEYAADLRAAAGQPRIGRPRG